MAVNVKVKKDWKGEKVKKKIDDATFKSFSHAAASLRLIAKRSIRKSKKASMPNTPPKTQTSRLPKSIVFFVDKKNRYAIIGPSSDLIGVVGGVHEQGGLFKGAEYPQRPFMVPAMEKIQGRLPSYWATSFS
jgi:phage gpG-like protein